MSVSSNFSNFCARLTIDNKSIISSRHKAITRRLNISFYNSESEVNHTNYIGSYGRGTAIRNFHDLDVLFQLPKHLLDKYHAYASNGQSSLLQYVRSVVLKTYPNTRIGGDRHVVAISFADGMRFEILPAFLNSDKTYTYPDANGGGTWRMTNPFAEINAITALDKSSNGDLKRLCRMARAWRRKWRVDMGGLHIDTLAYSFFRNYKHRGEGFATYDILSRDFFAFLEAQSTSQTYWLAPGSNQRVFKKGAFRQTAKTCHGLACEAIHHSQNNRTFAEHVKWRAIYGPLYP